jgi:hypothetical protein
VASNYRNPDTKLRCDEFSSFPIPHCENPSDSILTIAPVNMNNLATSFLNSDSEESTLEVQSGA